MSFRKLDPLGRPQAYEVIANPDGSIPVSIVSGGTGGSGGASLSDSILTDDSGTNFVARDNGSTITYVTLAGGAYTPSTNIRPFAPAGAATSANQVSMINKMPALNTDGGAGVHVNNTTAVPANVQVAALYYPNSLSNNTVAQLAAGATFTGGIETVLSLQAAQVEIVSDQPYTVVINQYIDAAGTQKSGSRTIARKAGQPMNSNFLLPGNYFNLSVTNNGAAATTTLAVATTFGIMDSVDDSGRMTVITPQAIPYTAQQKATATATALSAQPLLNGLVITASPKNVGDIMVGGAALTAANDGTGNGEALQPGVARSFPIENASQLYIIWATGNTSATDFVTISGN